jgi:transcriptional regulator with XRE-family HTH domain
MGQHPRRKPARLAKKLSRIRAELGLSQNGMIRKLGFAGELRQSHISGFELGSREPSLVLLLEYARAAGVPMEVLVDDGLELPERIPNRVESKYLAKYKKRK